MTTNHLNKPSEEEPPTNIINVSTYRYTINPSSHDSIRLYGLKTRINLILLLRSENNLIKCESRLIYSTCGPFQTDNRTTSKTNSRP